jgi:hypothetical protein
MDTFFGFKEFILRRGSNAGSLVLFLRLGQEVKIKKKTVPQDMDRKTSPTFVGRGQVEGFLKWKTANIFIFFSKDDKRGSNQRSNSNKKKILAKISKYWET